ncbi:zinc ribbon domain-containing protein [Intestinibacter sp.]|uniref:zinc ribbon domain-containing protein n=2 Tax=Intestinibacter sp. TaxID=1965304 RepID=UPI002A75801A|nr:zinc ribbon domain-containing protein [Intestinibacter sp.]MDY2737218.1 zinc ribbon domain-containing protein [Intestinibacter sp.]
MICKNCGTNNSDSAKFCIYCASPLTTSSEPKKPQNRNKKNNNNKIIGIVLAFVSLIVIILGGYFVLNGKIFKNEISIDAVTLDGDYEMDGDRYVLFTNENVIVMPNVTPSDSSYELEYEIEDTTAANIEQLGDKCSVIGLKETDTNLNIYSDDKILKVVKLSFKDKNDNAIDKDKNDNGTDKDGNDNSTDKDENDNGTDKDKNDNGAEEESIPTDKLDIAVSNYLENYERAVYCGDFNEISDYVTYNGPIYKELKKTIPSAYENGITVLLSDYEKKGIKKLSNGEYKVSYVVKWTVNNQDGTRLQTEYADYIIKKEVYEYKVDRLENWEILSKVYQ